MNINEKQILERLQGGDRTAARLLYDAYAGRLTAVCSRYVADGDDVKDVMQDAFVKIFTNIASFTYRGEGSLRAWMTRITVNRAITFLQNSGRLNAMRDTLDSVADVEDQDPDADGVPPDELQAMIRRLPDGYRTVLNLYVFENKSHKEIAALLGIKAASSASQLYHAKALMARMIKEYKSSQ